MNIGRAAKLSGVSAKSIRRYEKLRLLSAARRTAGGYRQYDEVDVATIRFIHTARSVGFAVEDIAKQLSLWRNKRRTSQKVKSLAAAYMKDVDRKINELKTIKSALCNLIEHRRGQLAHPVLDELTERKEERVG